MSILAMSDAAFGFWMVAAWIAGIWCCCLVASWCDRKDEEGDE